MNSILDNIAFIPCNPKNHGGLRGATAIRYLVYHYTANDGDRDTNNAVYYSRPVTPPASAHYFVDDDSITQSVDDLIVAWSVGGNKWNDCARTGGGKLYGFVTNSNSISIEMCDTNRDGTVLSTEATVNNAIELGKMLMQKYDIPIENVVRHFDVTGKYCPRWLMDNDKWAAFKARLINQTEEEEEMQPRYNAISELPDWAKQTVTKLVDKHLLNGGGGEKDEDGRPADLDLSGDMVRMFVINDRAGLYD